MATFDSARYIESTKEIIFEYLKTLLPDTLIVFSYPDIANDEVELTKPMIAVEFNSSKNIDYGHGKVTGRGTRAKRKMLRYSFQIISSGDGKALLERDKIAQVIEMDMGKPETCYWFAKKGLTDLDIRFVNSYRARENIHVARLELFVYVTIIN